MYILLNLFTSISYIASFLIAFFCFVYPLSFRAFYCTFFSSRTDVKYIITKSFIVSFYTSRHLFVNLFLLFCFYLFCLSFRVENELQIIFFKFGFKSSL